MVEGVRAYTLLPSVIDGPQFDSNCPWIRGDLNGEQHTNTEQVAQLLTHAHGTSLGTSHIINHTYSIFIKITFLVHQHIYIFVVMKVVDEQ